MGCFFGPHIASTPKKRKDQEKEFCNLPRWQAYALSIIHQIHQVHHQPRNQVCGLFMVERGREVKPHFRWGSGSKFLGTKLELFEANWILELDPFLDPSLHLGSPNHELSFELFFLGLNRLIFLPKWWPCRFSLHLPLFGLGPSSKGHSFNLLFSANRIALLHWTLDLRSSSKVALSTTNPLQYPKLNLFVARRDGLFMVDTGERPRG